jgi:hypothetical protein
MTGNDASQDGLPSRLSQGEKRAGRKALWQTQPYSQQADTFAEQLKADILAEPRHHLARCLTIWHAPTIIFVASVRIAC